MKMKKLIAMALAGGWMMFLSSCSENHATKPVASKPKIDKTSAASVKEDGTAIGSIETDSYVMKLHRAFAYEAQGSDVLAGFKPKEGFKFIYLDVSLRNKGPQKLDGGFLFIDLKLTGENGVEYKKPAAALAAYTSEHPEDSNTDEYNALWGTFDPNEFHREIVYAVEVPKELNSFVVSMPVVARKKDRRELKFSL